MTAMYLSKNKNKVFGNQKIFQPFYLTWIVNLEQFINSFCLNYSQKSLSYRLTVLCDLWVITLLNNQLNQIWNNKHANSSLNLARMIKFALSYWMLGTYLFIWPPLQQSLSHGQSSYYEENIVDSSPQGIWSVGLATVIHGFLVPLQLELLNRTLGTIYNYIKLGLCHQTVVVTDFYFIEIYPLSKYSSYSFQFFNDFCQSLIFLQKIANLIFSTSLHLNGDHSKKDLEFVITVNLILCLLAPTYTCCQNMVFAKTSWLLSSHLLTHPDENWWMISSKYCQQHSYLFWNLKNKTRLKYGYPISCKNMASQNQHNDS